MLFRHRWLKVMLCLLASPLLQALDFTEVERRSELWPYKVHLAQDMVIERPEGAGPFTLVEGLSVVLVRCEGGKVLFDTGRFGMHAVEPEKTDILLQAAGIQLGTVEKSHSNLYVQVSARTFDPSTPDARVIPVERYEKVRYYFFLYSPVDHPALPALMDQLRPAYAALREKHPEAELLFLGSAPDASTYLNAVGTLRMTWPTMPWHFARGYIRALAHDPDLVAPTLVLTDADNKILARVNPLEADLSAGLSALLPARP